MGRGLRGGQPLLGVAIHVLDHDHRIVDQDADRQRERHHCHRVDRKPKTIEEREAGYDGGGDRDRHDQGRANVAQKYENDERGEHRSPRDREGDVGDCPNDECGGVECDDQLDTIRQPGPQLVDHPLDLVRNRYGVLTGLLTNHQGYTPTPVQS